MFDPRNLAPDLFADARRFDVPEESIRRLIAAVVGRGILDPSVWAREYQIPRGFATRALPDAAARSERSVTSARDGFQKLLSGRMMACH